MNWVGIFFIFVFKNIGLEGDDPILCLINLKTLPPCSKTYAQIIEYIT